MMQISFTYYDSTINCEAWYGVCVCVFMLVSDFHNVCFPMSVGDFNNHFSNP